MLKDMGKVAHVFPMPVLMIAAYDENGKVNVMNAAWGMNSGMDKLTLFISKPHKTTQNILKVKAFTVALADKVHMDVADYFGIVSGNDVNDKFERTGYTAVKSTNVNAPVIQEFPVTMECELLEVIDTENTFAIVGQVVNMLADETVLNEKGRVDIGKLDALTFSQFDAGYYETGAKVGQAWGEGKPLANQ